MEKEFIPYEQALALKELGFDEPCLGFYNIRGLFVPDYKVAKLQIDNLRLERCCLASTFSQAFRWFRDNHNLVLDVVMFYDEEQLPITGKNLQKPKGYFVWNYYDENFSEEKAIKFESYEEAELECLKKLIEIVKKNEK